MADSIHLEAEPAQGEAILLPAPTAWPIILAFGCTLAAAGMVTDVGISILGGVFMFAGCVGWFRQVLPHEHHEEAAVVEQPVTIASPRLLVERIRLSAEHRAHFPLETYPVKSGIAGGIAGGIAMILPALLYGLIAQHSIWYAVNLLGGAGVAHWTNSTATEIAAFHWQWLLIAILIHSVTSLLIGLLYGAMLPILPRHPVVLGGILAPVLWTGILHSFMGVINPTLADHIAWGWFLVSQVVYGITAGIVVSRQERIPTSQSLPFIERLGIEAPGLMDSRPDAGPPRDEEGR
ncbi:MAG TPA: hypothetical protein VE109_02785 [Acidobacteriaceae bacterium]|nr:hypothetical protein [Acidobacteriaceae bacterium]